ncbi:MAG: hypothetical protein ABSE56_21625 [Bryobacteraceae bacterium]
MKARLSPGIDCVAAGQLVAVPLKDSLDGQPCGAAPEPVGRELGNCSEVERFRARLREAVSNALLHRDLAP